MAEKKENKLACVAGFVKGPVDTKDGSETFWVGTRPKKRFSVRKDSKFALEFAKGKRALVLFEKDGHKNPKIKLVLSNPSGKLIAEYNSDLQ